MNTITYMTGLFTFYLKGVISTDQNFLRLKIPNTILALIPLGAKNDNIPVAQVASVSSNFKLNLKRFLAGIVICVIGIGCLRDSFVTGLLLLLWGASTIITSFATELLVATTSGAQYYIPFLIFEKAKASQAEQLISNMINSRLNDTNNRQVAEAQTEANRQIAEAQTQAIVNAINNNK